jgi:hypothetical protein
MSTATFEHDLQYKALLQHKWQKLKRWSGDFSLLCNLKFPAEFLIIRRAIWGFCEFLGSPLKMVEQWTHGLINYVDNKAKCRHLKLTYKVALQQRFIRVYRLETQSVMLVQYFRPSFVNCCPSPLLSGSIPRSPLPCVKCVWGGGGGLGF